MDITVGVIGTGNMGAALVRGWSRGLGESVRLLVWDAVPAAMDRLAGSPGVVMAESLTSLVAEADVIVLVVKPKDGGDVLRSLSPSFREGQTVVSAMAGVLLETLRVACGPKPALFRVMPNLGVEMGTGMVAVSPEAAAAGQARAAAALDAAVKLFDALGVAVVVPETSLDIVTAVSGTGPALLAIAVEALEDGGVMAGLPRTTARTFARGAMLGAARKLTAQGVSAVELERQIEEACAPVGEGLGLVKERRVRAVFEEAVAAAAERSRQMRAPSGTRP
jgi:pyrroline-5-carboxylate reductase